MLAELNVHNLKKTKNNNKLPKSGRGSRGGKGAYTTRKAPKVVEDLFSSDSESTDSEISLKNISKKKKT